MIRATVAWLTAAERYVEKLATPDVTIADMIGDIDPIKGGVLFAPGLTLGLLDHLEIGATALIGPKLFFRSWISIAGIGAVNQTGEPGPVVPGTVWFRR